MHADFLPDQILVSMILFLVGYCILCAMIVIKQDRTQVLDKLQDFLFLVTVPPATVLVLILGLPVYLYKTIKASYATTSQREQFKKMRKPQPLKVIK